MIAAIAVIATIVLIDTKIHSYLVVIHIGIPFYLNNFYMSGLDIMKSKNPRAALFSLELFCFELVLETSIFTKYCLCHRWWVQDCTRGRDKIDCDKRLIKTVIKTVIKLSLAHRGLIRSLTSLQSYMQS